MFLRHIFMRRVLLVGGIVAIGVLGGSTLVWNARGASPTVAPATSAISANPGDDGSTRASRTEDSARARLGFRPRLGRHVVHAVVTVERNGDLLTFQVDRGSVTSIADGKLTISEQGGASVTLATNDQTRVRRDGRKISLLELKSGDEVYVISRVSADGGPVVVRVVAPTKEPSGN
jgi:hypothetical protein